VPEESLTQRVTALEERLADLLARLGRPESAAGSQPPAMDMFWALDGLRERVGPDGPGAVLFTGTVDLPTGEHYDWQLGAPVGDLLADEWTASADALGALGNPVRLALLRRILGGARTAAELAADEGLGTTGQIYHHLRQLVSAGWLRSAARGHFAVPGDRVIPLLVILAAARR